MQVKKNIRVQGLKTESKPSDSEVKVQDAGTTTWSSRIKTTKHKLRHMNQKI